MQITRRGFLRAGAAVIAAPLALKLSGCAGSESFVGPGVDAYELVVGYKEQVVGGFRIRTRTYGGGIPGPTITTAPGRGLRVTINNQLPPNPHAEHSDNPNNPHDFNTTNLHVHGLHVVPHLFEPVGTSNPDAKLIAVEPGERYTYNFDIPQDQPPGLYWYHAHHHGSTAVQSFSGMAGLIIVRGNIDEVPEIKAAREQIVAVQSIRVEPDRNDPSLYVMEPLAGKTPEEGGFKAHGYDKTIFCVNGEAVSWLDQHDMATQLSVQTVNARPGEVIRFRMLNGADDQLMPMQLDGHTMHVIGYDGIALPNLLPQEVVELAPANRVEFLIRAGAPGTYAFRQLPVIGEQFADSEGMILLNLSVSGEPMTMGLPAQLPPGMEPLPEPNAAGNSLEFETIFPSSPEDNLLTGVAFKINNLLYKEDRIDHTSRLGTVEDWNVSATMEEGHPLHVHVNAFQVLEIDGQPVDPPIYKDTVWVRKGTTVKIRMPFDKFAGKTVYHCHILIHEDTGMMQNLMIQR